MVYRGPSKGCATCRKRRVKCDETHPACKNCTSRNSTCPGFPPQIRPGEVIVDETRAVLLSSRNKTGRPLPEDQRQPQFANLLSEDDIFTSVCFFFNNYAIRDRGLQSTRSELKYLPEIYATAPPESLISASITALTLSFLSMWRGLGPDSVDAQRHAARAISSLRKILSDPVQSRSDETLLAIMMLQFRETVTGTSKFRPVHEEHQRGAYAVIKHRGARNIRSPLSKALVQSLRSSSVFEAIRLRRRIDTSLTIWEVTEDMPEDPNDTLSWLGVRVTDLQVEFEEYQSGLQSKGPDFSGPGLTVEDLERLESFKVAALQAEQGLIQWEEACPPLWRPVSLPESEVPSSVREAGLYHSFCHVYPSVSIAGIWHSYRLERLVLLRIIMFCDRTLLRFRQQTEQDGDLHPELALVLREQMFRQLVDDVCAAVPFHLGNRTGPGSIDEFSDTSKLQFPWAHSDRDPWRHTSQQSDGDSSTQQSLLSVSERKREALALGCWHILGPLGITIQILNESADIWPDGEVATKFNSLVRDGQMRWMLQQLRRVLIVQKMIRKENPLF